MAEEQYDEGFPSEAGDDGGEMPSQEGGAEQGYTEQERKALHGLFAIYDRHDSGYVSLTELALILEKVGRDASQAEALYAEVIGQEISRDGSVSFGEFLRIVAAGHQSAPTDDGEERDPTEADEKVVEFLRILEEYRAKCEAEGDYIEAGRASTQLETLRKQEQRRQEKALRAQQIAQRQDVQIAHNMQFDEFNASWDQYMEEYDRMSQMYVQQMQERHATQLEELRNSIMNDATERPAKYSKELLDWRRKEKILAKQKAYAEAQKIKRIADELEIKERRSGNSGLQRSIKVKEERMRKDHTREFDVLLKRVSARRQEHLKQRKQDMKRLVQRNRNVQQVLESKQATSGQKRIGKIRSDLAKAHLNPDAPARSETRERPWRIVQERDLGGEGSASIRGDDSASTTFMT